MRLVESERRRLMRVKVGVTIPPAGKVGGVCG